jgi:hypothetical protein
MESTTYYYLVMSQKDLLQNQSIEEILREKSTFYSIRKKQRDFWLCISPKFLFDPLIYNSLKLTKFYEQKKNLIKSNLIKDENNVNFFVSLVSLDKEFINWLQLRLGYFENINDNEFLKDINKKDYVSDGIRGTFQITKNQKNINPLQNYSNYLHPDILLSKNQKFLELYYKNLNQFV